MCHLVKAYYALLRRLLHDHPQLRKLLVRCRHCGIFFLCDPRNRHRHDLGCPFGCADALNREASADRSASYYHTPEGRQKKKRLNANRYRQGPPRHPPRPEPPPAEPAPPLAAEPPPNATLVTHLATVATLVEGRRVTREEILQLLQKIQRQRSMARRTHLAYAVAQLQENPP